MESHDFTSDGVVYHFTVFTGGEDDFWFKADEVVAFFGSVNSDYIKPYSNLSCDVTQHVNRDTEFINELGVYDALYKNYDEKFDEWLFHKVLPSLRKNIYLKRALAYRNEALEFMRRRLIREGDIHRQLIDNISEMKDGISNREEKIATLRFHLKNREEQIERIKMGLTDRDEQIERIKMDSKDREEQIERIKMDSKDREDQIERIKMDLTDRDEQIERLKMDLTDRDERIAKLKMDSKDCDEQIERLKRILADEQLQR